MNNVGLIHVIFLLSAVLLEVLGNIFTKRSNGFRNKLMGILGILCIMLSFTALAQAVKGFDLSIAYAIWGGIGLLLTTIAGLLLFNQKLTTKGWLGVVLIIVGISILRLS